MPLRVRQGKITVFLPVTSESVYGGADFQYISYEYVYSNDDRDLMFAKSTDHGLSWTTTKLHGAWLDGNVYTQTSLTNAEGYLYLAYRYAADFDSIGEIRVERSTDSGSTWSQFSDIDGLTNDCQFPSITATASGDVVMVAFQYQWSANDIDVCYSYSADNGATWVKGNFLFSSYQDEKSVSLTSDGNGSIYAICKAGRFAEYSATGNLQPTSWSAITIVSDAWVGEGLVVNSRLSSGIYYPYVICTDARTKDISFSVYDTIAPLGSIIINSGDSYATLTDVTLTLTYADGGSGVNQVRYSNDGVSWSSWETAMQSKAWALTTGDGIKTVYYQIMDNAGQLVIYSDTILLDSTPPLGSIVINGGYSYAVSSDVNLVLTYSDSGSGVSQVRYGNDGFTWSDWASPSASKAWTLSSEDGLKTVYYQIKDNTGQTGNYTDTILLDTTAPTGSIVINADDSYATSTSVTLTVTFVDDGSGVNQVRFSNDGSIWSDWASPSETKSWSLSSGDGGKTVYYQISDYSGLISSTYSDTIVLQTHTPTPTPSSGNTNGGTSGSSSGSSTASKPTPSPTQTASPTPTPSANPAITIIHATVDKGGIVDLTLIGNITSIQITNAAIVTDQEASTITVSFTLNGEAGTGGFANVTIPKNAVPYGVTPVIYIDGQLCLNQGYTEDAGNYYVWYTTHFSTHRMSIVFKTPVQNGPITLWIAVPILAVAVFCIAVLTVVYKRKKRS